MISSARPLQLRRWLEAAGYQESERMNQLIEARHPGQSWIGEVLAAGVVSEQRFFEEIAKDLDWPFVDLDDQKIEREVLTLLPSRFVFLHLLLPLEQKEASLTLATCDPFNHVGQQLVREATSLEIRWVLVSHNQLIRKIKTLYGVGAETFDEILENREEMESLIGGFEATDLDADETDASVVKFVNQIIREAIQERATDIHVEPLENDLRIRYRIDGILSEIAVPSRLRVLQSAIITRLKIMAKMDIAERRLPQDGRINL